MTSYHCSWVREEPWEKILWRREWLPTPVLLPGKSHGWRSLVGCSPWGHYQLDTTERLHFHFPLSCIGEGNGNPLQCSCLENPRDQGAWWTAIYGVTQSRTWLKRLSSRGIFSLLCSSDCWITRLLHCFFYNQSTILLIWIGTSFYWYHTLIVPFLPLLPLSFFPEY